MENKTNKIIELANSKKYIIIRQIFYKGVTYFVAGELLDDKSDLNGNIKLFEEKIVNDKTIVSTVVDTQMIKLIYEHLDRTENN